MNNEKLFSYKIKDVFHESLAEPYWTSADEGYSAPIDFSDSETSLASQW